jgi:hypothetical protein
MSPFSAPFSGAPKSEGFCLESERLLYGREPNVFSAEPGKQRPRSCRTQELAEAVPRRMSGEHRWRFGFWEREEWTRQCLRIVAAEKDQAGGPGLVGDPK